MASSRPRYPDPPLYWRKRVLLKHTDRLLADHLRVGWDSVDKCPDYQINLYPSDLCRIVGEAGFKRIWSIPRALQGEACSEEREPDEHGICPPPNSHSPDSPQ